ncbi:uncharacterized protein [Littorina saxatilis]|uniref:uncharacterized protein n=1 Tax=Littorina saxatilis TaxID=31220 RepID=UPI0038B5119B
MSQLAILLVYIYRPPTISVHASTCSFIFCIDGLTAVKITSSTTIVFTKTITTTTHDANTEGEDKSVGDNNNDDRTDTGLPIAIIAGGAGGGLVVIIIIVVVVVVVVKKRRGDFEEHINDLYESSDARPYAGTSHLLSGHNAYNTRDTTEPSTVNEESETAFGYLTVGSSAPQATPSGAQQHNQILESDLYSSPDENGAQPPVAIATQAAPKGADVYAAVNKPDKNKPSLTMVTQIAPKGADVYAVVNKPCKASPQENPESQNDEHAVVDKARSGPKNDEGLETTISAEGETEYGSRHVYSQVNKTQN